MRKNSSKLVLAPGLTLSGILLAAVSVSWSGPAAAEFRAPTVRVPIHVGTGAHTFSPAYLRATLRIFKPSRKPQNC